MPVKELHDQFEVGFVLVLRPKPGEEAAESEVVSVESRVFLFAEVDEHAGVYAGDAVENGFCEVHLPLVFPGGQDVLHFGLGVD